MERWLKLAALVLTMLMLGASGAYAYGQLSQRVDNNSDRIVGMRDDIRDIAADVKLLLQRCK